MVAEYGCTDEEAFRMLATASQGHIRKVRDITQAICLCEVCFPAKAEANLGRRAGRRAPGDLEARVSRSDRVGGRAVPVGWCVVGLIRLMVPD